MRNPPDVPGVRSQRTRFQKLLAYLKRYWFLYLLVLPGFVFMIVFNYGPMYGIQLAFKDYHANLGIWGSPWVGLEHFREMIADANFWRAAKNTLIINGYNIVFKTTFTIFLALMLNELRLKKVKSCVQTAAYLPYFLSWVIFAGLVQVFLEYPSSSGSSGGVINQVIMFFGGEPINFNGLADKIGRSAARRHDIIGYDRHRVERAQPAAVGPVTPGGVICAVEIDLRAEQRQNPGKQEQHIRQNLPQLRPVFLHEFLLVHADQNAERSDQQQKQRDRAFDVAGDGHGVKRGDGEIGDPEHERQPQIRRDERDLDAVIDRKQNDGHG